MDNSPNPDRLTRADFGGFVQDTSPFSLMGKLRPWIMLARLDRPIGTWLLLLPGWQGLALGLWQSYPTPIIPSLNAWLHCLIYGLAMGIGAILMRGAGCVWNDLADIDFDRQVARTSQRPLAAGVITKSQAMVFLTLLSLLALVILLAIFPRPSQIIAIAALPLVLIYPFMKRFTWFPQAWLGLTFNWGIWVGYSAFQPAFFTLSNWQIPALLYGANWCWTMGYDTIYAHQDKNDDALIGVKSTALFFADHSRLAISGFYFLQSLICALILYRLEASLLAWVFWLGFITHLIWQLVTCDFDNPQNCLNRFRANRWTGWLLLLSFIFLQIRF